MKGDETSLFSAWHWIWFWKQSFTLIFAISPKKKKDSDKGTDSLNLENLKFEINFIFNKVNWYCKKTAKHFSFHNDTEFNLENSNITDTVQKPANYLC